MRAKSSRNFGSLIDNRENSPSEKQQIMLIFIFIAVIVLYLLFRFGGLEKKTFSPMIQGKNKNNYTADCYNILGYKNDNGGYNRRKCWYDLIQNQLEYPPTLKRYDYPKQKDYVEKLGALVKV